jgi:hypothetical protein
MKREHRDVIIAKVEEQMIAAGSKSYDDGMRGVSKVIELLKEHHDPMRTKEQFEKLLVNSPDPSWVEMQLFLGTMRFFPQIMRFAIQKLATHADENLPQLPKGRPGLDLVTKQRIVASVSKKHMKGYTLEKAKKSVALQFGQSESTIQRAWDTRGSFGEADFRSVLKFLGEELGN